MKILVLVLTILGVACSSIEYKYVEDDSGVTMTGIKTYSLFYDDEEKIKIKISKETGGRIESISWEGKSIIAKPIIEQYPSKALSFHKLNAHLINDGQGLVDVLTTNRGIYQFRRSYNLKFDEEQEMFILEIRYNVKNHSSDKALEQKWDQKVSLDGSDFNITPEGTGFIAISEEKNVKMTIKPFIDKAYKSNLDNEISMGHSQPFELGTKERLSWVVKYELQIIDSK